jgi:hypothetical protein
VVALASGFFATDSAVFLGFLQIGRVDIDKKRRLAGELSSFWTKKHQIPRVFLMLGRPHPASRDMILRDGDHIINSATYDVPVNQRGVAVAQRRHRG